MASVVRQNLSGSTDGKPIKVGANAAPGTLIHTATSSSTPGAGGVWDEVWLWCYNSMAVNEIDSAYLVRVQLGGTGIPNDVPEITVPPNSGSFLLVGGLILQNSLEIRVYAGLVNKVTVFGYVNRITN